MAMVVMAGAAAFDLVPLPLAALTCNFAAMINSSLALGIRTHKIKWRATLLMIGGCLPMIGIGVWLLDYLSSNDLDLLRLILAGTLTIAALGSLRTPAQEKGESGPVSFILAGGVGGIMGGLLAIPGPPLVFQLYRQPYPLEVVRDCLLFTFMFTAASRILIVAGSSGISMDVFKTVGFCLPVIFAATWIGKKFPPPITEETMKKGVLVGVLISALGIAGPVFL